MNLDTVATMQGQALVSSPDSLPFDGVAASRFASLVAADPASSLGGVDFQGHPLARWLSGLSQSKNDLTSQFQAFGALSPDMGLIPMMNRMTQLQIQHSLLSAQQNLAKGVINQVKSGLNTLVKGV